MGLPERSQLFAVLMSQLPLVAPSQMRATSETVNLTVLVTMERVPTAPTVIPSVTDGAEPLFQCSNG